MTFLNLALLAGMAALAVPLLIHLLSRRRYTPINWGAMFLIEQVVRQNRRRLRLEQWILLAVRCAIPVVLALAMARPVMTGWRALAGDEPTAIVVILDASYSMSAPTARGVAAVEEAETALRSVIGGLPKNSQATVLVAGSGTRIIEQYEPSGAADKQIAPAELGPMDARAAIAAAETILKDAKQRRREIVLISDFQKLNFESAAPAPRSSEEDELRPQLSFLQIGTTNGSNCVVEDVTLSPATVGAGRPVRVRAVVRNAGAAQMGNVPVRLLADGEVRDEARLNLAAGASSEATFITRFDTTGPHTLEVQTEGDSFSADNTFRVAVDIPKSLGILLVSDQSDLPFPQNPTDFLSLALDPQSATGQAALSSLLRPQTIRLSDLSPRALADARVVILANVPTLSEQQITHLREFVSAGGGLIVFPGDRTDIAFTNGLELFPARLTSLRGESSSTRIAEPPYAHPALVPWNDPGNGRLGEASIRRWYSLQPRAGAGPILGLESGEPLLVEAPLGRGSVIMAATSAGSDWSDLPLRAGFLPLIQQLVTYAASRANPPWTVTSGDPLALPLAPEEAQNLVIMSPTGSRHIVSATLDRGRMLARFADTSRPGFYRLVQSGRDEPLAIFAVNPPRAESQLDALSREELLELAAAQGASVASSAQEYAALDHDRRYGREVWRGVWVFLLALLFGELLLQAWFARNRDSAIPGGVL